MKSRSIVTVIAGAVCLTVLAAAPASAAPASKVWVTAGSAPSGTTIGLRAASSSTPSFKNLNNNAVISCASSTLSGAATTGPNQSPTNVGSISASTWGGTGGCTALGTALTVTQTPGSVWGLSPNQQSVPATAGAPVSGQTTVGVTSGVSLTVNSATCRFVVTGSAGHTLVNNSTTSLSLSTPGTVAAATLTVTSVMLLNGATTCLGGLIQVGNKIQLSALYALTSTTSAYNPIWFNAS